MAKQKINYQKDVPASYWDKAVFNDISTVRDHLSAYVANIDSHPVVLERYNKPVAAIVRYTEYRKLQNPKNERKWKNTKEYEKYVEELSKKPVEEVTWEDLRGTWNPSGKKLNIDKLIEEAWIPEEYL
jgi:PHD/YefM family antitoxin component YafN of YafNO toxin-antitoxin module